MYYLNCKVEDLIKYQKDMICLPHRDETKTVVYQNDWHTYFEKIYDGDYKEPKADKISVIYHSYDYGTFAKYAREVIGYGKRKDKMIEKNITVIK